ncbi:MAG: YceI family protein, partial [Pseudomonadota bacterium]
MLTGLKTNGCAFAFALIGLAIVGATGFGAARASADTWRLDPKHAEVRFSWDHLGLSRQSGKMTDIFGKLVFSPTEPTAGRVDVTMLVAGLQTGVPELDRMLKSSDYFDARRFPRVTFKSDIIEPKGSRIVRSPVTVPVRDP